jgi:hypothetical protein
MWLELSELPFAYHVLYSCDNRYIRSLFPLTWTAFLPSDTRTPDSNLSTPIPRHQHLYTNPNTSLPTHPQKQKRKHPGAARQIDHNKHSQRHQIALPSQIKQTCPPHHLSSQGRSADDIHQEARARRSYISAHYNTMPRVAKIE